MILRDMSDGECRKFLEGSRLARLACSHDNRPYVTPIYLAYDDPSRSLYGFTTAGQKTSWMRLNPLVCVEVDEVIEMDRWTCVIIQGRYEELGQDDQPEAVRIPEADRAAEASGWGCERSGRQKSALAERGWEAMWGALENIPAWWQSGCAAWKARNAGKEAERIIPIFYRIRLESLSGRVATPT